MQNLRDYKVGIETPYCSDCGADTYEECVCDDLNFADTCEDCGCDSGPLMLRGCNCQCHVQD